MLTRLESRYLELSTFGRKTNYDAAVALASNDLIKAKKFVEIAYQADRENIHMWCNKGVLLLKTECLESDRANIEYAAFKALDLLVETSGVPRLNAKIDHAYWLAEADRSEIAWNKGCQILSEILRDNPDMKDERREYASYLYLKVLVRYIRSEFRYDKQEDWLLGKSAIAAEQLILLSKSANGEYRGLMWLWLAELQCTSRSIFTPWIETFCRETEFQTIDQESCINKAYELMDSVKSDTKFKLRIAKICLSCGWSTSEPTDRIHWFNKCLQLCDNWRGVNHWSFMYASNSVHALIQIWAVEFYKEHPKLVDEIYMRNHNQEFSKYIIIILY